MNSQAQVFLSMNCYKKIQFYPQTMGFSPVTLEEILRIFHENFHANFISEKYSGSFHCHLILMVLVECFYIYISETKSVWYNPPLMSQSKS